MSVRKTETVAPSAPIAAGAGPRQAPPGGVGAPPPAAGDGQGGAAAKKYKLPAHLLALRAKAATAVALAEAKSDAALHAWRDAAPADRNKAKAAHNRAYAALKVAQRRQLDAANKVLAYLGLLK